MNALLFKHDSTYGAYDGDRRAPATLDHHRRARDQDPRREGPGRRCRGATWASTSSSSRPASSPTPTKAKAHIDAGAQKVIISAPAKGEDITIVLGVNEDQLRPGGAPHHQQRLLHDELPGPRGQGRPRPVGIEHGLMNTIHSYTNDQRILDVAHKDPRRARSAGQNIIPTTTGAAKALALVIPDLKGKFDGFSLRVPTPTVSVVDFTATVRRPTTRRGAQRRLPGRRGRARSRASSGCRDEPLVSTDFRGDTRSSIIDAESTMVLGGNMVKVIAWYDNEWGYSCRVADLIAFVAARLPVAA